MKIVISGMNNGKPLAVTLQQRHKKKTYAIEHDGTKEFFIAKGESLYVQGGCCIRNDGLTGTAKIVRQNKSVAAIARGQEYYALEPFGRAKSIITSVLA